MIVRTNLPLLFSIYTLLFLFVQFKTPPWAALEIWSQR